MKYLPPFIHLCDNVCCILGLLKNGRIEQAVITVFSVQKRLPIVGRFGFHPIVEYHPLTGFQVDAFYHVSISVAKLPITLHGRNPAQIDAVVDGFCHNAHRRFLFQLVIGHCIPFRFGGRCRIGFGGGCFGRRNGFALPIAYAHYSRNRGQCEK